MRFKKEFLVKYITASALIFWGISPAAAYAQQWSLGFWEGDPTVLTGLDWSALTHVAHVAAFPNPNGSLSLQCWNEGSGCSQSTFASEYASPLISAAHSHGVKVLFNIATGYDGGAGFAGATGNNVNTFVSNIVNIVNTYGYDGVDIDWEANFGSSYYANMSNLIAGLRQALGTKLIVADMVGDISFWAQEAPKMDRIAYMTYDLVGNWNPYSWFNSPVYSDSCDCVWSLDLAKRRMEAAGIPASKINLGIPFYGYISTGGGVTGPRQSNSSGPSLAQTRYNDLVSKYNLSQSNWDSETEVPWVSISNGWITFDNAQSIADKIKYINSNGLGGWIMFSLEKDYIASQNPTHPLLAAVKSAMGTGSTPPPSTGSGATATPPSITSTSPLAPGTEGMPYLTTLASSGSTPITWSVVSNTLPAGLSLSAGGVISGTPTAAGSFLFTIEATNSAGSATLQASITINPGTATSAWVNVVSKNSGKCLDVSGASTAPDTPLQQWTCWGGDNQKFQFTPVQNGYEITVKHSGLAIDVEGGVSATQNGARIIQWPWAGGYSNEIWKLSPTSDGYYAIIPQNSGKCMDVPGNSKGNGMGVVQETCSESNTQQWKLVPVQ